MARSECTGCREVFNSEGAFNKHRVGSFGEPVTDKKGVARYAKSQRRCLTVDEMVALGMSRNERGWWIIKPFEEGEAKSLYGSEIEKVEV